MRVNLKRKSFFGLTMIIFIVAFIFISQAKGQEVVEKSQIATQKTSDGTRITISTSGPAEFSSYWLDGPPRLIVEFKSRNIISKIDKEVIVNQGVIKKITPGFFGRGRKRSLKLLTFELRQKAPYKIWQEGDAILLDIQAPLETPIFHLGGKEILSESETSEVITKRLKAMDAALVQVAEREAPLEIPEVEITEASLETPVAKVDEKAVARISKAEEKVVSAKTIALPVVEPARRSKAMVAIIFSLAALILASGLGFFVWRRRKLDADEKIKRLKLELQERNKRLEQEEMIRKAMEQTALEKEKEHQQLSDSLESLKGELIEKGMLKRELSAEEKERPWVPGKSKERRQFLRLPLSRDYNRTIILRIETQGKPKSLKSFASNIGSDGLCFETKEEFKKEEPVNLRFFFYGDAVPMMKIQAHIVWKKEVETINYYGVYFDLIEEKDKLELNRYIESKIAETTLEKA